MCFFLISLLTATIYNPLRQKRRRLGLLSKITTRRSFFFEKKFENLFFYKAFIREAKTGYDNRKPCRKLWFYIASTRKIFVLNN